MSLINVMLIFCEPFSLKFNDYYKHFPKINCFYLISDQYVNGASKLEKIDKDLVEIFLADSEGGIKFSGVTMEPHSSSSLMETHEEESKSV